MPSRSYPRIGNWVEWIYVIDLDQNVFHLAGKNDGRENSVQGGSPDFRLDHIPRWFFGPEWATADLDRESPNPLMTGSALNVPVEYWADYVRDIPVPKPELLQLYRKFSPQPVPVFSIPPAAHLPAWRRLQLQLLQKLAKYFLRSFHDACSFRNRSPFVLRQLAHAVLGLTRGAATMKFHSTNTPHKRLHRNIRWGIQTPNWEPPSTDSYWLSGVLILLDENIRHSAARPAAIVRAVQLACPTHDSPDAVAVIFSIRWIVIVNIHQTPQGPKVSHSGDLPLFDFGNLNGAPGREYLDLMEDVECDTLGIQALMDLFSARPPVLRPPACHPRNLPTEICEQIFRCADPTSQCMLEQSCLLFREIARQYPRIGGWTLINCTGNDNFIGLQGSSQSKKVVQLEDLIIDPKTIEKDQVLKGESSGCEVGLWGDDGVKFRLNLPLLFIQEVKVSNNVAEVV